MAKSAPFKSHLRVSLNLLYPQGAPQKLPFRFLKWLISYGRFIVVVVEVIVLFCFAFRFKLDADLADLKEKINSQIPYLEGLGVNEALIKQTQIRLTSIRNTYTFSPIWSKILNEVSRQMPIGVKLTSLNMEKGSSENIEVNFKIAAFTQSNNDLAVFLAGLKNNSFFKDINLSSITFDQDSITFTITGATKGI